MKATIISFTTETDNFSSENLDDLKTLSGKNAGICYQKEQYFNSNVTDPVKAFKRFSTVCNTGHHSIADHVKVEIVFENISKMLAILLNSLQDYSTSEKSGRYTIMKGNTKKEKDLYNKWTKIYKKVILEKYPDIGDMLSDKLAQENARYVLSVFTRSTTMGYTTSLRQWNYIYDWSIKYINCYKLEKNVLIDLETNEKATYFETQLYKDLIYLSDFIKDKLYVKELRDNKNRSFDFLCCKYSAKYDIKIPKDSFSYTQKIEYSKNDILADSYTISYPSTFVNLAQAQRHRTIKYYMKFNPYEKPTFYIPDIIVNTEYEKEWLKDLNSVSDIIPQATVIGVIETGHISNFILKCEERLCGRAQYEIMMQTKKTAERFLNALDGDNLFSEGGKDFINELKDKDIKPKCLLLKQCKEPCYFGCKNALNRLI